MYKMIGVRAEFSRQVLSFVVFARFFLVGNQALRCVRILTLIESWMPSVAKTKSKIVCLAVQRFKV